MKCKAIALLCLPIFISACASTNTNTISSSYQAVKDAKEAALMAEVAANNGSPWIFIGTSTFDLDYYLDLTSIEDKTYSYDVLKYADNSIDFAESQTKAWWKIVDTQGNYTMTQSKFYCSKGATASLSSVRYDSNDQYLGKANISGDVSAVIPGTVFSEIVKKVCDYT